MKRLLFLLLLLVPALVVAQSTRLAFQPASKMWVDGTSTLHDWTVEVQKVEGALFASGASIDSVRFQVPVNSLKSGKGGMDSKMYEALKAERHPIITVSAGAVSLNAQGVGTANARVTIGGFTKTMPVQVTARTAGAQTSYTGAITFKMTDFRLSPPTAMMGTIKAGDTVTLRFDLKTNALR